MEWVSEDFDHRFTVEGDEVVVTGTGLGELRNRVTFTDLHSEFRGEAD